MKTFNDFLKGQDVLTADDLAVMDKVADIIATIVEARKGQGLTQQEVADICGWKQPIVGMIEKGKREPQLTTLIRLLTALGLRLEVVPISSEKVEADKVSEPETKQDKYKMAV